MREATEKADRRAQAFNLRRSLETGDGSADALSSASAALPTSAAGSTDSSSSIDVTVGLRETASAAAARAAWSCLSRTLRSRRQAACAAANDLSSSPTLSPAALLLSSSLAATSAFNWCSRAATRLWRARSQAAALPPVRTVYCDLNVSGEPKGGGDGRLLV